MPLTRLKKKHFVIKAQSLKPVVMMAGKGLTENVLAEVNNALEAHELIKIRISIGDREERKTIARQICEQAEAELIHSIGHIIVVYRPRRD